MVEKVFKQPNTVWTRIGECGVRKVIEATLDNFREKKMADEMVKSSQLTKQNK